MKQQHRKTRPQLITTCASARRSRSQRCWRVWATSTWRRSPSRGGSISATSIRSPGRSQRRTPITRCHRNKGPSLRLSKRPCFEHCLQRRSRSRRTVCDQQQQTLLRLLLFRRLLQRRRNLCRRTSRMRSSKRPGRSRNLPFGLLWALVLSPPRRADRSSQPPPRRRGASALWHEVLTGVS